MQVIPLYTAAHMRLKGKNACMSRALQCQQNRVSRVVVGDSDIGVSSLPSRSQVSSRRSAILAQMAPQLYDKEHYNDARDRFDDNDEYMPDMDDTTTEDESPLASHDSHHILVTLAWQCLPPSPMHSRLQRRMVATTTTTAVIHPQVEPKGHKQRIMSIPTIFPILTSEI